MTGSNLTLISLVRSEIKSSVAPWTTFRISQWVKDRQKNTETRCSFLQGTLGLVDRSGKYNRVHAWVWFRMTL